MIRYILFDLDNTLYPSSCGLDREIDRKMTEFVASYLAISIEQAHGLRKSEAIPYGTTLQWLRLKYGFHDLESYFAAVHPENVESFIDYNPDLVSMLKSIPLPMAVLTNSPMEHARRVLNHLRLEEFFTGVYDIRFNGFRGKPYPEAYHAVIDKIGTPVSEVLFIDDLPRYLIPFKDLGGCALLVDEKGSHSSGPLPSIKKITELETYLRQTA
jgi:putative hydrolase of the HAD superfamily